MDSSLLDQADEVSPETSADSSVPPDSPDRSGISGEPLVHPRVGNEYQVEIPCLLPKSELLCLMMNPAESEDSGDASHSFLIGLPVPLMWVCNQVNPIKDERMEFIDTHASLTNGPVESENIMRQISILKKEPIFEVDAHTQAHVGNAYSIVPGLSTSSWSDFEADCFLLGLYIFGKDLLQVTRFMDGKDMGQILSFYYGQFYGSAGYHKWSECRKMRNRKCVLGHRFFTGYRQQELFSRLLPRLCDESKTKLLEASRAFAEGRTSLDVYVSSLKALGGIHALVEAVGIGKGKDDLTTLFMDSSKNTQMFLHRPEIPSGKACSSLTCAEIVKYLTGDFRLSKARSNDLFWEAVWPRLLARGWHSEQPRVDGYTGSKNCLVFLMPGIKKFSRRKLAKGDHYFDSVSDVLAKVASEPELLELEEDETKPNNFKGENGWGVEVNSDDQDPSDHERHCYLKPRVSAGLSNLTKFTVVDTSLADEDNPCKVRELRSLPLEAKKPSTLSCRSRKNKTEPQGNADSLPIDLQISTSAVAGVVLGGMGDSQRRQGNILDPLKKSTDTNLSTDHKSRAIKHQFSRRVKPGLSNCLGSVTKKRRLTSCVEADVTYVLSLPAGNKNNVSTTTSKNSAPGMSKPHVNISSTDSSVACTPNEKIVQESLNADNVEPDFFPQKETMLGTQKIIDLNLPQVPTVPDIFEKIIVEVGESENYHHLDLEQSKQKLDEGENITTNEHSDVEKPKYSDAAPFDEPLVSNAANKDGGFDQQPRRQSTRNRPLTTKALEALEIGFLNPVRHSRKRSPSKAQEQKSKRSRQLRSKNSMFPNVLGIEESSINVACNGKLDILGTSSIGPIAAKKEAETSELLGFSIASCTPEAS